MMVRASSVQKMTTALMTYVHRKRQTRTVVGTEPPEQHHTTNDDAGRFAAHGGLQPCCGRARHPSSQSRRLLSLAARSHWSWCTWYAVAKSPRRTASQICLALALADPLFSRIHSSTSLMAYSSDADARPVSSASVAMHHRKL